jgi:7-keto-8-aminopelargonate synthetase-like enzyme
MGREEAAMEYAARCKERGILLSAIRPPSVPKGTSRIRLTVTAAHTREELDQALEVMVSEMKSTEQPG